MPFPQEWPRPDPFDYLPTPLDQFRDARTVAPTRAVALATPANSTLRVLVTHQDPAAAQAMGRTFMAHGYQVRASLHVESAFLTCQSWRPHLVITEHAASWNGIDLCRRIRAISPSGVIVVAKSDDEATCIEALDSGADDVLTQPYSTVELMARTRAVLRRAFHDHSEEPIEIGAFRIDFDRRRAYVRGMEVKLTPKAFELLVYFVRHPNRVIERSAILKTVWCEEAADHPEYLRAYIGQIRKRIEPDPSKPRYLLTESWVGYRFHPYDGTETPEAS